MIDNYYAYYIKLCYVDINKIKKSFKISFKHTYTHKSKKLKYCLGLLFIKIITYYGIICISAILDSLCKEFLSVNVSAILYLMNYEQYGRSTASAQYFLQLAGYLGIPVIAWNADNSGLERVSWFN